MQTFLDDEHVQQSFLQCAIDANLPSSHHNYNGKIYSNAHHLLLCQKIFLVVKTVQCLELPNNIKDLTYNTLAKLAVRVMNPSREPKLLLILIASIIHSYN